MLVFVFVLFSIDNPFDTGDKLSRLPWRRFIFLIIIVVSYKSNGEQGLRQIVSRWRASESRL